MIHKTAFFLYAMVVLTAAASANAESKAVHRFYNARILNNHEIQPGELWICDGKIIAPQKHANQETDVHGSIIAPGYIDLQVNGGFGVDFSFAADQVGEVASQLPQYGVTAFLPTLVSLNKEHYAAAMPHLQPRSGGSRGSEVLGMHLEGPFFSPQHAGAHNPDSIIIPTTSLEDFYGSLDGVRIVTLAPELLGMATEIHTLKARGIVVSAGHTNASYEDMQQAVKNGVGFTTHLFNAMTPFHHRNPGIIGAVLGDGNLSYSVIADGVHLHPGTLNMAWQSNPKGLVLVTDAMQALGLPAGTYTLGDMKVDVEDGKAYIHDTKTLAGSVLSMDDAVRNLRAQTGCSLVEAVEAATLKPARVLGIEDKKGTLNTGADADFIVLDDDLQVQATYINGELAWGINN
jgi:N-acetylglucosamine-6-phosphate deacetylase